MLKTIVERIYRLLEFLLMISLLLMVVINFVDVLGRKFFNHPIFGIQDLTEHLMASVVFCGLPLVTMAGLHLTVDLFDKFMNHRAFAVWRHIITGFSVIILLLIAWTFLQSALEAQSIADVSPELRIPRSPLYGFMSLSALLSALGLLCAHSGYCSLALNQQKGGEL